MSAEIKATKEGLTIHEPKQIYELIGKAMAEIGAIGKDSKNETQGFMYRGIDAVYNALNPIMAKYGLFITPEILDHKREERTSTKTWYDRSEGREKEKKTTLLYSIITVRYTVYAPDGSSIQITVIGEGMDSGDKATNKAMSIAMKYAMFQLFMIPTEAVDPDRESHEVDPAAPVGNPAAPVGNPAAPASRPTNPSLSQRVQNAIDSARSKPAEVTTQATLPPAARPTPNPDPIEGEKPGDFMKRRIEEMKAEFDGFNFIRARTELIKSGTVKDIPSATMTMEQAKNLMDAVHKIHASMQEAS